MQGSARWRCVFRRLSDLGLCVLYCSESAVSACAVVYAHRQTLTGLCSADGWCPPTYKLTDRDEYNYIKGCGEWSKLGGIELGRSITELEIRHAFLKLQKPAYGACCAAMAGTHCWRW